jgi:hypothetical protein
MNIWACLVLLGVVVGMALSLYLLSRLFQALGELVDDELPP